MELCTLIFTARTKQKCKEKIEISVFSVPRFETATVQQTKKKAKLTVYLKSVLSPCARGKSSLA